MNGEDLIHVEAAARSKALTVNVLIERGAKAMEARRRELIEQPLARIWPELMRAAVASMLEPTREMQEAAGEYENKCAIENYGGCPSSDGVWYTMIIAALGKADR